MWKGFETEKEAKEFKKKNGGYIASEKKMKDDYELCLNAFGMNPIYKFVVIYSC